MGSSANSNAVCSTQFRWARVGVPYQGDLSTARPQRGSLFELLYILIWFLGLAGVTHAADLPPRPSEYFNDLDSLVKKSTAQQLDRELADFEHQTSTQLIVVIYPKLPSGGSIGQYAVQLVHAWKLDQRGAVFLVDDQNHLLRIQAGSALKGKLSEAKCKQIFIGVIMPRFKADDFDGGIKAGVAAVIAAVSTK